jgi:hypothetical protein
VVRVHCEAEKEGKSHRDSVVSRTPKHAAVQNLGCLRLGCGREGHLERAGRIFDFGG